MLLSIQFPVTDVRRFLHRPTGCISQPGWPSPVFRPKHPRNPPFVRGFGAVRPRKLGGLEFWGEDRICDARNAVRWVQEKTTAPPGATGELRFAAAFCHYYFDGEAVGKCEMGVATIGRPDVLFDRRQLAELSGWFLSHPVSVPSFDEVNRRAVHDTVPLHTVPARLQRHVLRATTRSRWMQDNPASAWWIDAGSPMVFLQLLAWNEDLETGWIESLEIEALGVTISCHLVIADGLQIPFWILRAGQRFDRTRTRQLRLCIMRMHAEHESLRLVLDHLSTGRIPVKPGSAPTQRLQRYLQSSWQRLNRNKNILGKIYQAASREKPDIWEMATAAFNKLWPGQMDSLDALIEQVNLRRNIGINLKEYSSASLEVKELYMGDVIRDNTGSIINNRSELDNVAQTISASQAVDAATRQQMEDLVRQLSAELKKLPPEQAEDKEAVEQAAADLVTKATQPKPNKKMINISANGMLEAAKGIAGVVPIALKLSKLIGDFITGI